MPNGDGLPQEATAPTKAPERKVFRSLNVSIRLGDDVGVPEALAAVEGLGELQSIQIYQQRDYGDEAIF